MGISRDGEVQDVRVVHSVNVAWVNTGDWVHVFGAMDVTCDGSREEWETDFVTLKVVNAGESDGDLDAARLMCGGQEVDEAVDTVRTLAYEKLRDMDFSDEEIEAGAEGLPAFAQARS